MSQKNSYGAEIGVFNDRLRDALRGGTTDLSELSDQGFVTGLLNEGPPCYGGNAHRFVEQQAVGRQHY